MSITHCQHNKSSKPKSIILNIPVEVYIDICKYLPPIDLVTLSLVCKKFRQWLIAPSNFGTEQIWRTSRTNFLSSLRTPPPGISEQCYTFLHLIELGCQFCEAGKVDPRGALPTEAPAKIYWIFRVRCCRKCLTERVVTTNQIQEDQSVLDFALSGLPFLVQNNRPCIYWKKDVEDALREFASLDTKDIFNWQTENLLKLRQKNLIASYCNNVTRNEPWKKWHRKTKLRTVIHQLSMIVPNDANRTHLQVEVELRRCPTYKKYTMSCPNASSAMKLFNEHHWNQFQEIIHHEYNEKREYAALRARQYDLFLKVYSLIPSKYSMNDPIVQYLCHCPSFKKPPLNSWDNCLPWDNNFLDTKFIPQLAREAQEIANKRNHPPPITTTSGAQKIGLSSRCVFLCKLCVKGDEIVDKNICTDLFEYKNVRMHLRNFHGIKNIIDKKMIMTDFLEVGKQYLKRDSRVVCFFLPLYDDFYVY
ncbi:hypothetical protein Glove_227g166 [Diversispora epigaea]|uniref:F-box domain-containing protein n=1 Tax=Diversispora epigaea TaxID=1348612 RepID=A0A397ILQ2_9GLOM|nr:hypothetical protein Glove_227g166 [Diversispora epigaea]